ncbi:hypothetical protein BGZ94_005371 [Podila epigama]|nr:hypothetical protein BGZ94_005371 [Podila epigama]
MENTTDPTAKAATKQRLDETEDDFEDLDDTALNALFDTDDNTNTQSAQAIVSQHVQQEHFRPQTGVDTSIATGTRPKMLSSTPIHASQHAAQDYLPELPVEPQAVRTSAADTPPEDTDLLSSDDEDLAALEELNRKRAELEAKLRTKRLRKATMSDASSSVVKTPSPRQSTPQKQARLDHTPSSQQDISSGQGSLDKMTLPEGDSNDSDAATTLPLDLSIEDTNTTPVRSPRTPVMRTPSPPSRSRFLMSPPSGAYSRKRHHSPSPLPRRGSFSSYRPNLASTPTSSIASRDAKNSNMEAYRTRLTFDTPSISPMRGRSTVSEETALTAEAADAVDDQLDDAYLDKVLDNEDGDLSAWTEDQSRQPLVEEIEAREKRKAEELLRENAPRPTFKTVASGLPMVSHDFALAKGHTLVYDALTKLRIAERYITMEAVVQMTYSQTLLPIKETEQIRIALHRPSNTGALLSKQSGASVSVPSNSGRLESRVESNSNSNTKAKTAEAKSWILAGVVGAKSKIRTTAKKARYCHFQLSDLNNVFMNVFMFRKVLETHYNNIKVGDVVVIMNPKLLNQTEKAGTLGVEVDDPGCLFILGRSTDYGLCEAVKLNGEDCGRILDRRASIYCQHHIMMATNKHRNQRGSLIAGTSSIYDLNKTPFQNRPIAQPRRTTTTAASTILSSSRETTYIFDDGGVGTSSLTDPESKKKDPLTGEDGLSSFLMNQNNPGGMYLRQAKTSKDVAWAKDVTSPKTPTKNSELFPVEMIRRMGYDPVTGQFVPGSPKRASEDPEARERSIRMLAERVKSPPAPPAFVKTLTPRKRKVEGGQEVAGDVFFGRGPGQKTPSKEIPNSPTSAKSKRYVNLNFDSSSDDDNDDDKGISELAAVRERNLVEARKNGTPVRAGGALTNPFFSPLRDESKRKVETAQRPENRSASAVMLMNRTAPTTSTTTTKAKTTTSTTTSTDTMAQRQLGQTGQTRAVVNPSQSSSSSATSAPSASSLTGASTDTRPNHPPGQPASKKGRFVDLSDDSE